MFDEPESQPGIQPVSQSEITEELLRIAKLRGVEIPKSFAEEISSLWSDPPPWSPWTN